jgi:hypothetical protein
MHAKVDFSARAHTQPLPPPKPNGILLVLLAIAGWPGEWVLKYGTPNQIRNLLIIGIACTLYFLFWTVSIATGLHVIFDFDHPFDLMLIAPALLIAAVQAITDHITQVKPAIRDKGHEQLETAGTKLPREPKTTSAQTVRAARPVQGLAFAGLTTTVLLLAGLQPGIQANVNGAFQKNNPGLFAQEGRVEEEKKSRDVADLSVATERVNTYTRAIEGLVRRDAAATRRPTGVNDPKLEQLQKQLEAAKSEQMRLRDAVLGDDANRNINIQRAVSSSPSAVARRTDLAAQLGALWSVLSDNPFMWIVTGLLLILGCSLELGFMWVAASYPSSALCARLVLEEYEQVTDLTKEGQRRLDVRPDEEMSSPDYRPPGNTGRSIPKAPGSAPDDRDPPSASALTPNTGANRESANDNVDTDAIANRGPQPKRGRGRPKGSTSQRPTGAAVGLNGVDKAGGAHD